MRALGSSSRLRRQRAFGVTSRSSSFSRKSRHCSRLKITFIRSHLIGVN